MASLVIAGVAYEIHSRNARLPGRVRVGQVDEMFDGSLRSLVRAYKDRHAYELLGPTGPLTVTEFATLKTNLGLGMVTVSGDVIGGTYTADVEIMSAQIIWDLREPTGYRLLPTVEIRQA